MRLLPLVLVASGIGCSSDKSETSKSDASGPPPTIDAAPIAEGPKRHPATVAGLEAQLTALIAAAEGKDKGRLASHVTALVLNEPEEWFAVRFASKRLAGRLFREFKPLIGAMPQLAAAIREQRASGLTEVVVEKYEKTDDLKAVGYQTAALKKMVTATPLFSVRLKSPDKTRSFHVWSFVHQDGQFRFIGKMKRLTKAAMLDDLDLAEFTPVDAARLRNAKKPEEEP